MSDRLRAPLGRFSTLDTRSAKPPPKTAEPFYRSQPWRDLLARLVRKRGRRCELCGTRDGRIIGDHVVERRDGGAELDESNVRLTCLPCHNRKTAKARTARLTG